MEYHPVAHRHQHSPYGVQLREAVVYMYFTLGYSMSEVAFHFGGHPNRDTVSRIVKDYLQQGEVVAPAGRTGVIHATRKFDALAWETLLYLVQADSQSTLYDLARGMEEFLGSTWSMQDVSRALHESGFVWKCVENKAAELDPFKMQLYREMWDRRGYTVNQPVFVDEVGTNSLVVNKRRGWVQVGERSTSRTICGRGKKYTMIAAMWKGGLVATSTFEGAADTETFLDYIASSVLPRMNPFPEDASVLVMDNCAIHNKDRLRSLVSQVGVHVVFLPPYCPIYNPIENLFGSYKTWLRSNRELVAQINPYDAINLSFDCVTPAMCEAWIRAIPFYNVD